MSNRTDDVNWIIKTAGHNSDKWYYPLFMSVVAQMILVIRHFDLDWTLDNWPRFFTSIDNCFIFVSILVGWVALIYFRRNVSEDSHLRVMKDLTKILTRDEYDRISRALYEMDVERRRK